MHEAIQLGGPALASQTRSRGASVPRLPSGLALLRPVYCVAAALAAGIALRYGGLEGLTITLAAMIGLWSFFEAHAALWLATAFMMFLFVFFQTTAPLGEDLPAEFFYWGIGVALITAGLLLSAVFSRSVDWRLLRDRARTAPSLAMAALLLVMIASTVYGLAAGDRPFIVWRQLFGCVLLPSYFFLAIALFRAPSDVDRWLRRVSWVIALGSVWYVEHLSLVSFARGVYYREQSPLVSYGGAVAVVAWVELIERRRASVWLQSLAQLVICILAILLMGNRTALGSFLGAIAIITALIVWKRRGLALALAVCLAPICVGVAPYVFDRALAGRGLVSQIAGRFIFALDEDQSYQGRVAQTAVVMNMVNRQPILGAGMGSENSFVMPGEQHRLKVASVDNGWGFLLLKMGYVGLAVFLALVAAVLKAGLSGLACIGKSMLRADRLSVLGVFVYALISFVSGPIFFHFSVAPFFGVFLGALVSLRGAVQPPIPIGPVREGVARKQGHA